MIKVEISVVRTTLYPVETEKKCNRKCELDKTRRLCVGCNRNMEEIKAKYIPQ
jgi:hypothetical protein